MWFFTVVVVLLIGAVAVVASGRWGGMAEAYDDRPDMRVPSDRLLGADDIESSRFAVGVRGYRMDEVDSLLERVSREVAERDRRIADLERAVRPIAETSPGDGYPVHPVENPSVAAADVVHAPVGRHAARRSTTHPDHGAPPQAAVTETATEPVTEPMTEPVTEPVTEQPTPSEATAEPPAVEDTTDTTEVTQAAAVTEAAETGNAADLADSAQAGGGPDPAGPAEDTEATAEDGARPPEQPMPVVIPRLRDPEPAKSPSTEAAKHSDTPTATEATQPERPAPVVPRLRDPDPSEQTITDPPTAEPPTAASAPEVPAAEQPVVDSPTEGRPDSGGAPPAAEDAAERPVEAEDDRGADADTAEGPAISESANGAQGAAEQAERRVWSVHGAPSQTVRPAPKRTDDAVRPAPRSAQQGPKAGPRSVPTVVQEPAPDESEGERDQSPAERRA